MFTGISHSKLLKLSLLNHKGMLFLILSVTWLSCLRKISLRFFIEPPVAISSWYCTGTVSPWRHPFTLHLTGIIEARVVDSGQKTALHEKLDWGAKSSNLLRVLMLLCCRSQREKVGVNVSRREAWDVICLLQSEGQANKLMIGIWNCLFKWEIIYFWQEWWAMCAYLLSQPRGL